MRPLVVLAALLAAGCSSGAELEPVGSPRGTNLGEDAPFLYDAPAGEFREVRAGVIERDDTPMICTDGRGDSDPPTCGDIEVANWDWNRAEDEDVVGGIRWGVFHFYGLVHRGRFYVSGFAE